MEKILNYSRGKNYRCLFSMDANAWHTAWGSQQNNARGAELMEFIILNALDIHNDGTPTFRRGNSSTCIDLTLSDNRTNARICDWESSSTDKKFTTDHHTITFTMKKNEKRIVEISEHSQN